MSLLERLSGKPRADIEPLDFGEWLNYFEFNGLGYPFPMVNQTYAGGTTQEILPTFTGLGNSLLSRNGIVWACVTTRNMLFAEAAFQFRRKGSITSGDLYGTTALVPLEEPWPGGTTRKLLALMELHVQLAGNGYAVRDSRLANTIRVLRPDWVTIVLGSRNDRPDFEVGDADTEVIGYAYRPGGDKSREEVFLPDQVAHFMPHPDPIFPFRGASWVATVIREIMSDSGMTEHKLKFLENGATANMVVTLDPKVSANQFDEWVDKFEAGHKGAVNAYRTIYLAGGADAKVVGSNLKELDFRSVQAHSEPLALDTPVPTPDGWTTMGEIKPGDMVFGRNGLPIKVLDALQVHTGRDCYEVAFADGTSVTTDGNHLWTAIDRQRTRTVERQYSTLELRNLIAQWKDAGRPGNRISIKAPEAVELPEQDLLIDPYVLGAWLGDGATAGAAICGATEDLKEIASEIQSRGYTVTNWNTADDKVNVIGLPGGVMHALQALGVLGDKRIPAQYLRASVSQRLDLLRGLMDTDGGIGGHGDKTCTFSSKWEHLSRQVAELARSLGYRVSLYRSVDPRSRTNEQWRVCFRGNPAANPFLLARKAARLDTVPFVKNRAIVSIEPVESVPVRCIAVDSPDHLFLVGEGWVPTHNTRICNAAGIPPIVVGVSEGLDSATYSNYAQARRAWADSRLRPMWAGVCSELGKLVNVPGGSELWYDERRIAFLAEDLQVQATIQQTQANTLASLTNAGWTPESAAAYVESGDLSKLIHSGLYSIQLQPPGTNMSPSQTTQQQPPQALACSLCHEDAGSNEHRCHKCAELAADLRTRPAHVVRHVADQLRLSDKDAEVALGLRTREPEPLKLTGEVQDFLEPVLTSNGRLQ